MPEQTVHHQEDTDSDIIELQIEKAEVLSV